MVDAIADQVLLAVNDMMDDLPGTAGTTGVKNTVTDLKDEETVLWKGQPFLSLVESYVITNERIKVSTGLLGKD